MDKPSTPSNEELTQRMEKLVRDLAARMQDDGTINLFEIQKAGREAQAIVTDLPKPVDPIDPDLLIAREIAADMMAVAHKCEGVEETRRGERDGYVHVCIALAALERGRTLEAGGTAHE